ncbi:MAG: hypothetical protein EOO03_07085 [Chitinophagaceae bacterium]|nr:MAG: hypothetical protein EOO03_07085 [Chitinophagaceae bacterium]
MISTMKTLKTIFAAALTMVSFAAAAQSTDEVVSKYVAAMGGAEKLASLKTVKMEGNINTQGVDVGVTITKKHLVGMRLDLEIMGTSNFQIATPTKGWVFMPVMQQTEPQEMEAEQLKSVQSQLDVHGSLFNYKEKGYTLVAEGTEKIDGKDAHKLKLTKDGKEVNYFVDAASGYIVRTTTKINAQGTEMVVENNYGDYKKNAEGFVFPYTNTNSQGVITFDKISANVAVDDKIFSN